MFQKNRTVNGAFFKSLFISAGLIFAPLNLTSSASAQSSIPHQDEIVVSGERTGPRLWRAVKDDSEIFVLVSVGLIPDDLEWNDNQVRQVLEEADRLYLTPDTKVNTTRLIGTLIRTVLFNRGRIMMKKGTTLADKVNPALAAKFEEVSVDVKTRLATYKLQEKAEGKKKKKNEDDALDEEEDTPQLSAKDQERLEKQLAKFKPERFHPYLQAGNLRSDAIRSEGLVTFDRIESRIKKMAKKAKVKSKPIITIDFAHADIKKVLKSMKDFSEETNTACMHSALDYINDDLPTRINLGEAWARGDVTYLQSTITEDEPSPCELAVSDELGGLKSFDGTALADIDLTDQWLEEFTKVLEEPGVRMAIIPAQTWLRSDGILKRLEAEGVTIYGPGSQSGS